MLTRPQTPADLKARLLARAQAARTALIADVRAMPHWLRWAFAAWMTLGLAVVVFLLVFDWNWARGPVSRFASAQLHRQVQITGGLSVHPWSLNPSAEVEGLTISQPAWAPPGAMASARRVSVQIKLLPLLRGQVILPRLQIDQPTVALLRDVSGQANWNLGDPKRKFTPLRLPAIQHFIINDGRLTVEDRVRKVTFDGRITSNELATGDGRGRFELRGDGTLNGAKFLAVVTGGPLLNITPDRPYAVAADVRAGSTHILANGQIDRPFDLGAFGAKLDVRGADLNNLYDLTGLSLPNTPPYRIAGALRRDGPDYRFNDFFGRVGDSDVAGDLRVATGGERPLLVGAITSRRLDFDDLGSLFGMPPSTAPGETSSAGQKVEARRISRGQAPLLPTATLQIDRIRGMDADVTYRAETVNAPGLPLRKVAVDVDLKAGLLKLDPIAFTFSHGDLRGQVTLDARGATPKTDIDLRLSNGRLEDFIPIRSDGRPAVEGVIAARAKLSGAGNSVHKAAAASNGAVTLVIPRGQIRQAFAELLGINASKALIMLMSDSNKQTPLRCAVADFKVVNGVLRAERIVFDTGVVLAKGTGTIDLETERMDLRLDGDSKKPRLVRLIAPITLKGPIRGPKIGVEAGGVAAQGGIGLALGALLGPLAAILPFVDPGLEKDADCQSLMAEARASAAPVRTVATTPAKP